MRRFVYDNEGRKLPGTGEKRRNMKRTIRIDPFFANQPEKEFLKELTAPVHEKKPFFFSTAAISKQAPKKLPMQSPFL